MSILTKLKSLFSKKTVAAPQTAKEKLEAKSAGAVTAIRTIINTLKDASSETRKQPTPRRWKSLQRKTSSTIILRLTTARSLPTSRTS